jgi:hypothetical protein
MTQPDDIEQDIFASLQGWKIPAVASEAAIRIFGMCARVKIHALARLHIYGCAKLWHSTQQKQARAGESRMPMANTKVQVKLRRNKGPFEGRNKRITS